MKSIKYFSILFFIIAFGSQAQAICTCSPQVTSAYTKEIKKLENYYQKLKEQISLYKKEQQKYETEYKKIKKRRIVLEQLIKIRTEAALEEKFLYNKLGFLPNETIETKALIQKNNILLTK